VPEYLSLVDKKEASLKTSNKRPIIVSSLKLSVITKTLNHRMLKICERENLFGDSIWIQTREVKHRLYIPFVGCSKES